MLNKSGIGGSTCMNSIFDKLCPQSLAMTLSIIKDNDDFIVYIVDANYQKQYYVSPNFEKIWGLPVSSFYENMSYWHDTVETNDRVRVVSVMNNQFEHGEIPLNNELYRIFNRERDFQWLKSRSFPLYNKRNQCIAIVGIIEVLSQEKYTHLTDNTRKPNRKEQHRLNDLISLLNTDLDLNPAAKAKLNMPLQQGLSKDQIILQSNNQSVSLTRREYQCLHSTASGNSAKEIARELEIGRASCRERV